MRQSTLEYICPTLTVTMTMETIYVFRQLGRQIRSKDAKPRPSGTRIIQIRFYFRILRIDPNPEAQTGINPRRFIRHSIILRETIESNMTGKPGYILNFIIRICRRISMGRNSEFLKSQSCFRIRTCCSCIY